jgi:hypothetical protein
MQASSPQTTGSLTAPRLITDSELEAVSGGFIYIPVVVGAFAAGVAIRAGIDKFVDWLTG